MKRETNISMQVDAVEREEREMVVVNHTCAMECE